MERVAGGREAVSATSDRDVTEELVLTGQFCRAFGRSDGIAIHVIAAMERRVCWLRFRVIRKS